MPLVVINSDAHFMQELNTQGVKLVVVDYTASWCGPCRRIAPVVEELSLKYNKAAFFKVDVDKCKDTAAAQGVSAMPTFILYRNRTKLDRIQGANAAALEAKIKQYYGADSAEDDDDDCGVPGVTNLSSFILKSQLKVLVQVDRCNDQGFNCEDFQTWYFDYFYPMLNWKDQIWSKLADSVQPPFRCPVKKMMYQVRNAAYDINVILKWYPEFAKYHWRMKSKVLNEHDELVLCAVIESHMYQCRKRNRKSRKEGQF